MMLTQRAASRATRLLTMAVLTLPGCARAPSPAIPPPAMSVTTPVAVSNAPAPRIYGSLLDRLVTGSRLRGALISIEGREGGTVTSEYGTFVLDSVPPGAYRLLARHPMLDSMGIDTIGVPLLVGDRANVGELSLPTAAQFIASRCARPVREGTGLVSGIVRSTYDDEPLPDVEVAAAWRGPDTTYAGGGLRERVRIRTSQHGGFLLCNVPRFTPVEIWARRNGISSPRIRVQLGAVQVAAYDMSLDPARGSAIVDDAPPALSDPSARAVPLAREGIIAGRIVTSSGDALPDVTVSLDRQGTGSIAVSDHDGRFTIAGVPPGVRQLEMRAIGFRVSTLGINVRPLQRVER
ncbi:MAG TPA: carboxypeptidase regulatory-like domain-containing protein, partial [Gemmatimonas sp.]|nr:carboxypeptidase regulatory-like domain-containing protein [Gemmatimonas sp.]